MLSTAATVIASQALISGAFSLTRQAVQLGFSPRVQVRHTSALTMGQIYISSINWFLMIACIGLVLGFRNSANLAAAYGLAVTTTMVITSILFFVVAREHFGWSRARVVPLAISFLIVDLAFFVATLFKIPDGGWFPLVVAAFVFTILTTWRTGRRLVRERLESTGLSLDRFVASLATHPPVRAPGASAYLVASPGMTPSPLLANLRHTDSLHEQVLVISVVTEEVPRLLPVQRAEVQEVGQGIHQITIHYGFMEDPDIPKALADRVVMRLGTDLDTITYFLGREALRVTRRPGMAMWREHLFAFLSRNSNTAANYFGLPPEQCVEIGVLVEL